jgi:hypothetical protein
MEYQKLIAAKDKNSVFEGVAGKPANADAVQSASVDKAFNNVFFVGGYYLCGDYRGGRRDLCLFSW